MSPLGCRTKGLPSVKGANWHNKRIHEMCRVTMLQTDVYRITSESLQKRTGIFSLAHYLASRRLL